MSCGPSCCAAATAAPARSRSFQASACAARTELPPELWNNIWSSLDKTFYPDGHPEVHMDGHCKCGKVQFRVDGSLTACFWCHCAMCRWHWAQALPSHTLWIEPASAMTVTEGQEHVKSFTVEKLSRNLRGKAHVQFCNQCGTHLNVRFSDPGAKFTLMWPFNFKFAEWGDPKIPRHGSSDLFVPRFHAHYENRCCDADDSLPKLADIWLEGMDIMDNAGNRIDKVSFPMPRAHYTEYKMQSSLVTRPEGAKLAAAAVAGTAALERKFRAVVVSKEGKEAKRQLVHFNDFTELPYQNADADVTVKVSYSTINFKDGIVLTGGAGVALKFPIVSGIDFAGTVEEDKSGAFVKGQRVVLTGHYNGQHMDGGHADMVRTRSDWLVPLPEYLSEREAMIVGTAGFTAMMCIMNLEKFGNLRRGDPDPVLVTGAAGGVGSFATAILNHLGYNVTGSVFPKNEETEAHCKRLGCKHVIDKLEKSKPLAKEVYAGCVETVGGVSLATSLASMKYGRAVSSCGLAGSSDLPGTVMPFILRGVKLLGIDSVQAPMDIRREVWEELGRVGLPKPILEQIVAEYSLEEVAADLGPRIMSGKIQGRALIDMAKQASAKL